MKMNKFYEVSKVLGRRTDTDGRASSILRSLGWLRQSLRQLGQRRETNLNTFFLRHASILTMNLC